MSTKFINRNINKNPKQIIPDVNAIINHYLSLHPLNRLRPNSVLYNEAIKQYNTNIQKTLKRPAIPSWFCGKINPKTNQLFIGPTDFDQRVSSGVVKDNPRIIPPISPQSGGKYNIDECLAVGTPGSDQYALNCGTDDPSSQLQEDDDRDIGGLTFAATDNVSSGCAPLMETFFSTYSQSLVTQAWPYVKEELIRLGAVNDWWRQRVALWDMYYLDGTTGAPGPMFGSGRTCQSLGDIDGSPIIRIIWYFGYRYESFSGQAFAKIGIKINLQEMSSEIYEPVEAGLI
jgi:hypothetical protein